MNPEPRTPIPSVPDSSAEPAKNKVDLSLTQVLGGALAAMTAAFLGSRLSVAGTVVGAAVASIVAAVAGSLYTASLRTTRERVRTVWKGRVGGSTLPATVETTGHRDPSSTGNAPVQPSAPQRPVATRSPRLSWRTVLIGALAAFALAAVALTGVELATGSSLSGGGGTTISQVTEPRPASPQEDATPSATPSSASPSPSTTPSSTPGATATPAPVPSATSTEQPTAVPSTVAPSVTPTPEATPSSVSPAPQG